MSSETTWWKWYVEWSVVILQCSACCEITAALHFDSSAACGTYRSIWLDLTRRIQALHVRCKIWLSTTVEELNDIDLANVLSQKNVTTHTVAVYNVEQLRDFVVSHLQSCPKGSRHMDCYSYLQLGRGQVRDLYLARFIEIQHGSVDEHEIEQRLVR